MTGKLFFIPEYPIIPSSKSSLTAICSFFGLSYDIVHHVHEYVCVFSSSLTLDLSDTRNYLIWGEVY